MLLLRTGFVASTGTAPGFSRACQRWKSRPRNQIHLAPSVVSDGAIGFGPSRSQPDGRLSVRSQIHLILSTPDRSAASRDLRP